jgi:ribosomal protein S18
MKDTSKNNLWTTFMEEYRLYFKSNDELWYETFELVKSFIDENKKLPSCEATGSSEKSLGGWLANNRNAYKNKLHAMKEPAKYDIWTSFLDEYREHFKNQDEIWYEQLAELKCYITEHKKRPSEVSKNDNEASLGRWLAGQLRSYKNKTHGMTNPKRYKSWTEFIELFNEYFDTGGKEAGEFVYAAENLLKFINIHYDFLKEQFIYKKKNMLFNGDFYWFLITEYQQYISIVNPQPLNN